MRANEINLIMALRLRRSWGRLSIQGACGSSDGWIDDVLIEVDESGFISAMTRAVADPPADAERLAGPAIPGMPNLHCHAFQRAMAGLTETRGSGEDSFWTWRQRMYAFVERIAPEHLQNIAAQLYVEMLQAGYTTVGEFHYLHHQADGSAYAMPSEMSDRIIAAAHEAGIAITHLPVLYACSGFGGVAPETGQRRFLHDSDSFADLVESLVGRYRGDPLVRVGIAPHSLRAVTREQLLSAIDAVTRHDFAAPIHLHIAEQTREVEECIAWSGQRPVEWLLNHIDVDERWCLIHATYANGHERERLAGGDAVVGLCPTTEANLGDGIFPAGEFLAGGGCFGIGSDSNISVNVIEELRLLEYGQRLSHRRRAVLASPQSPSVGRTLYDAALDGGARALAQPTGALEVGRRADMVVLDMESPALAQKTGDSILDSLVFAADNRSIKHVMVAGRWQIRDGRHARQDAIYERYKTTLAALLA
jgi:formimidoylglutamate deiminase